jgi:hypothetical protein
MLFRSLLDCLISRRYRTWARAAPRPATSRLSVELLEDRRTPTAMLTIGHITVLEGTEGVRNAVVPVSLSEPHGNSITVNYRTTDGTAIAGSDYLAVSGKLTFAKDEMSKSVLVPVIGDRLPEPEEYLFLRLSNARGAKIADGEGIVAIVDSTPRISIGDSYYYGGPTITFTVSLSVAYDQEVMVNFATMDGTAIAGVDYVAQAGTLTFAPGETTMTITVDVLNPTSAPNKYFSVHLSGASTYALIANEWAAGSWYYDSGSDCGCYCGPSFIYAGGSCVDPGTSSPYGDPYIA